MTAGQLKVKLIINLTLSRALFPPGSRDPSDLVQVILGFGIPVAVHSKAADCPVSSCTTASFLLVIVGGTEKYAINLELFAY